MRFHIVTKTGRKSSCGKLSDEELSAGNAIRACCGTASWTTVSGATVGKLARQQLQRLLSTSCHGVESLHFVHFRRIRFDAKASY